ncbi:MAG: histidine--tRNA ligase [Anaerolineae bacterium]|nr:histidine--tRNA ligase [Anaerolineae bacterium]
MTKFSRPTGTLDILPEEQPYWDYIIDYMTKVARGYGFQPISLPIFEDTQLFSRGVGEVTDIVEKEMYSFLDKGDNSITLRPEFTAGIVRAYIENGMQVEPKPVKLYSIGPAFRYERPQAGRFRQFHQFNAELIGSPSPLADLETMLMAWDIYNGLGFKDLAFQLNSTGCPKCRPGYVNVLVEYYREHIDEVCDNCKRRLAQNPLRVLDCKSDQCQPVIAAAPKIQEHLCAECATHFADLRGFLDDLGRPYTINHRLVRGLDYYTKTVFEVWAEGIGAQSAVCGGGRYDGLIELLGGAHTPAVGFATGLERVVMLLKAQEVAVPPIPAPPVFVVFLGKQMRSPAMQLLVQIRAADINGHIAMSGSLKSQLRQADKRGARFALILGEDEALRGEVILRDLKDGAQVSISQAALVDELSRRLS